MCSYAVGDRVLIYHTPGETESGRKLRVPWIGPYRITERHSAVGYSAVSELESKTARVHVNRLKAVPDGREVDASAPEQGLWPDVRHVLLGVLGKRTVWSIRSGRLVGMDSHGSVLRTCRTWSSLRTKCQAATEL
jgi:hypothetical protein